MHARDPLVGGPWCALRRAARRRAAPGSSIPAVAVLATLVLAAAAGCGGGPAGTSPSPSAGTASPTASPSPSPEEPALFPAASGDKYGFIDANGTMVITPRFDTAQAFSGGLALVQKDWRYGYVDPDGRLVVKPRFMSAEPFSEGLAAVALKARTGYIDATGAWVVRPRFFEAWGFHDGLASVGVDYLYGYIDKTGALAIPADFDAADDFSEGLAAVQSGGSWGFIDTSGAVVIEQRFRNPWGPRFSEGMAAVKLHGRYGYIDKTGALVVEPQYRDALAFSEGLAPVKVDGGWGYIDKTGATVIAPRYDEALPFSGGLAAVRTGSLWGYVDKQGETVIDAAFSAADSFASGLAAVTRFGATEYIDAGGDTVWPASTASPLPAGVANARLAILVGGHVWTMRADGSDAAQVTQGSAADAGPVWSPDGRTIAFFRQIGDRQRYVVCLVPSAGGTVRTLYRPAQPAGGFSMIGGLSWSPDGRRLAVGCTAGGGSSSGEVSRIVSVDVSSGAATTLLERQMGFGAIDASWHPAWSPDGTELLIGQSGMDAEGNQTWVLTLADGSLRRLPVADAAFASWSPDGRLIVASTSTQQKTSLVLVRRDGRRLATLARGGGWHGAPSVGGARFSPDGTWIAYTVGIGGIWLMRADGSDARGVADGTSPDWK